MTHGWRWYKIEQGKLRSPLQGYPTELAPDGSLIGCYFVPRAFNILGMVLMLADKRPYDFAITFGKVWGPFMRDPQMPRIASMQGTRYQAQVIMTDSTADLSEYRMPIVRSLEFPTMERIEKAVMALHA